MELLFSKANYALIWGLAIFRSFIIWLRCNVVILGYVYLGMVINWPIKLSCFAWQFNFNTFSVLQVSTIFGAKEWAGDKKESSYKTIQQFWFLDILIHPCRWPLKDDRCFSYRNYCFANSPQWNAETWFEFKQGVAGFPSPCGCQRACLLLLSGATFGMSQLYNLSFPFLSLLLWWNAS